MTAWFMVQSLVIGAWLAAGALPLEIALRRWGKPARGVWVLGLVALTGLTAWTIARSFPEASDTRLSLPTGAAPYAVAGASSAPPMWKELLALPQDAVRALGRSVLRLDALYGLDRWLMLGWLAASAAAAGTLLLLRVRIAARRRRWAWLGEVDGVAVRVAETEGPFVIGLAVPEIVLPAWAATLPHPAQQLILAHERAHVRGGDPWLLAVATLVVVVLPWHAGAWWMHARLRLAMELDCDRRCLAAGADAGTYGRLLIAAADHTQSRLSWRAFASAFAVRRSHLERRLLAMTTVPSRSNGSLGIAAAVASILALTIACVSATPSGTQVARDATVPLDEAEKVSMTPTSIAEFEDYGRPQDSMVRAARSYGTATQKPWKQTIYRKKAAITSDRPIWLDEMLIVLDGVPQAKSDVLQTLPSTRIAGVEILGRAVANQRYDPLRYPAAANGVVVITTKP